MLKLLRYEATKRFVRTLYALRLGWQLKRASLDPAGAREHGQAGKSAAGTDSIEPVTSVVSRFSAAWQRTLW